MPRAAAAVTTRSQAASKIREGPSFCQNAISNSRPGARPRTSRLMITRSPIVSIMGHAGPVSAAGRQIHHGVTREKAPGNQLETGLINGHHGPILGARIMRDPHGVPEHDVLVVDGTVGGGPLRQAVAAFRLVGIIATCI